MLTRLYDGGDGALELRDAADSATWIAFNVADRPEAIYTGDHENIVVSEALHREPVPERSADAELVPLANMVEEVIGEGARAPDPELENPGAGGRGRQ